MNIYDINISPQMQHWCFLCSGSISPNNTSAQLSQKSGKERFALALCFNKKHIFIITFFFSRTNAITFDIIYIFYSLLGILVFILIFLWFDSLIKSKSSAFGESADKNCGFDKFFFGRNSFYFSCNFQLMLLFELCAHPERIERRKSLDYRNIILISFVRAK